MKRIPLIIGVAILGLGASAAIAPSSAQNFAQCRTNKTLLPNGRYINDIVLNQDSILAGLRQRGYDVDRIEPWNGCVRAFIIQPNGGTRMMYFDPDTLQPLGQ